MARQTDRVEEGESLPRCGRQRCEVCVSTKVLTGRPESRRKMLSVDFAHAQACIHKESFISSLFPTSERRCSGCSSPYPAPFLLAVVQSKKHNLENRKHWALSSGVTQAFLNAKTEKLRWVIRFRILFFPWRLQCLSKCGFTWKGRPKFGPILMMFSRSCALSAFLLRGNKI